MFDDCKYIMIDETIPILFPCTIAHNVVANALGRNKVTSAGFVEISQEAVDWYSIIEVNVYGGSVSLKLFSKKEDIFFIKKMLSID